MGEASDRTGCLRPRDSSVARIQGTTTTAPKACEQMKDMPTRILLVEDNPLDVRLLREMLNEQAPHKLALAALGFMSEAENHLATNTVDVILLDLGLPDAQGVEAVQRAHAAAPRTPLVVLTGCDDELMADQALQVGAQDFLVKGKIDTAGLLRAIRYATQRMKAEVEMQKAQEEAEGANRVKGKLLAELQGAHAETNLFLRSVPSILIGLDCQGRITRWNLTATNIFGIDEISVDGRSMEDCGIKWLHPMKNEISRWLATESAYRSDNLPYEREGKTRLLGLQVLRIPAESGQHTRFIITGADVTERMGLELQLRQAQKLEGIGQLAAGIAHEINTPTQFVGDNTQFVKDAWSALDPGLSLLRALSKQGPGEALAPELLDQVQEVLGAVDTDYLRREIPMALDQSLEGIGRVARIVQAMKEFSHPGSDEKQFTDINKAI